MAANSTLGGKLGPRLADLMGKAVVSTTRQLTPYKVQGGMVLQERFFRLVSSEVGRTVSGLTRELAADPDAPPWLRNTLTFMSEASGQWAALLNFGAYGSGLSSGLTGIITNEIAPLVQKRLNAQPNAVLPVDALARMVARGLLDYGYAKNEAGKSAIGDTRFRQLVENARADLPPEALLELKRRGLINEEKFRHGLKRAGVRDEWFDEWNALVRIFLSPADLASMVDRGEIGRDEADRQARAAGLRDEDFQRLVRITGEPPATELLMLARRRGIIDRDRLARGIRQSPLRSEWIDVITELQWDDLSTLQAADAVLQGHMSRAKGRNIANRNGIRDDDFDVLVDSAGRPPGIEEMLELLNRGLVTEAQVREALLESPLKNKWIDVVMRSRRRIPPQEQVRMMVKHGVYTKAEGVDKMMNLGFSKADATSLVALAQADRTEADRDLTKAEILSLYEFRALDKAKTAGMLTELGYDKDEAAWLIAIGDLRRAKRETDAAASVVRSKFVAHKIDAREASTALDRLRVPADARDHLLGLWTLERNANVALLTPAQIASAAKKGIIDAAGALARLLERGYSNDDARIFLAIHGIG